MKRTPRGALLIALMLATGAAGSAAPAYAAPSKTPAKIAVPEAPESGEIARAMGELKWGMTRDQVLEHFMSGIREKYKPLIAKATGALEEDKLRASLRDELGKVRSSVVEFNGRKTGWDASFLKGEFTHKNVESLFSVSDGTSENYYFFIQNKLWKWYKAFKTESFEGKSFDEFAAAIQARYGESTPREGVADNPAGKQNWLEWQDKATRLRAVDNKQFYGFYSLVFEDKATLRKLPELRAVKVAEKRSGNALVDSITSAEAASEGDSNPDVVDRITGKIRHRPDAPAAKGIAEKPPASAPLPSGGVAKEDDPLKGL
jgi:hypothetical protein